LAVVSLKSRIRRRLSAILRRTVEPLMRDQVAVAQEAALLREEVASLEKRLEDVTGLMHELVDRLEQP
jgi:hypothetical protein